MEGAMTYPTPQTMYTQWPARSLLFMISEWFKIKTCHTMSFILRGHEGFLPDCQTGNVL